MDNSGTVQERFVYDPYGSVTVLSPTWASTAGDTTGWAYLFQGMRYDPATGLYHTPNREYSTTLGRWLQEDGGYWDGSNLYQALGDGPADHVDPSGQFWSYGWNWAIDNLARPAVNVVADHAGTFGSNYIRPWGQGYLTGAQEVNQRVDALRGLVGMYRGGITDYQANRARGSCVVSSYAQATIANGMIINIPSNLWQARAATYWQGQHYHEPISRVDQWAMGANAVSSVFLLGAGARSWAKGRGSATAGAAEPGAISLKIRAIQLGRPFEAGKLGLQECVDPRTLGRGARMVLEGQRLRVQLQLIDENVTRNTPIKVNQAGTLWDGHHGTRAAIIRGVTVDVFVIEGEDPPSGPPTVEEMAVH